MNSTPKKEFWIDRLADRIPDWLIITIIIGTIIGAIASGYLIFY